MKLSGREPIIRARKVISLPGSPRRQNIVPGLQAFGFDVVDAIDGRRLHDPNSFFDVRRFTDRSSVQPRSGEIGCSLSHLSVYLQYLQKEDLGDDEWVIVAEDDTVLSPQFDRDISSILRRCSTLDFVVLATITAPMDVYCRDVITRRVRISPVEPPLVRARKTPHVRKVGFVDLRGSDNDRVFIYGTILYAFNGRGVRRFVQVMGDRPYWAADDWRLFSMMGLRIGLIRPTLGEASLLALSEIRSGLNSYEQWGGIPARVREMVAIRTRLKQIPQVISLGIADMAGRRRRCRH